MSHILKKSEAIKWIRRRYDVDTVYEGKPGFLKEMNELITVYLLLSENSTEVEKEEYNINYKTTGAQDQIIAMSKWIVKYYELNYLTKEDLKKIIQKNKKFK